MPTGMSEGRWTEVEPSPHAHEREALDFVRRRLPNSDPWRAWSNFTFVDSTGRPSEVDLLVVGPSGVYLIEIKSYPDGRLDADPGTWRWHRKAGGVRQYDSPFIAADLKAKRLKSLLQNQKALRGSNAPPKANKLWVQALVFLSSPHLQVKLDPRLEGIVLGPDLDREGDGQVNQLDGLIARLKRLDAHRGAAVDRPLSAALAKAMDQADIRQSERYRYAGSYRLVELLDEGDTWQDYRATHKATRVDKRVRLHLQHRAADDAERDALNRAAEREFRLLQGIRHPGIESPDDLAPNPRGPATIYPHDPDAVRLDHWIEQHPDADLFTRLELFRGIAETVAYAHEQGLAHRSLSPRHVWVADPDGTPTPRLRDWGTIARDHGTTATRTPTTAAETGGTYGTRHPDHLVMLAGEDSGAYLAPELRTVPDASGRLVDVFGLGCLLHLLLTGQPPAADGDELQRLLDEHGHVPLAAAMDAAPSDLADLVRDATAADATGRLGSVADLLGYLDLALEDLTAPDEPDLLRATRGTSIDGWTILGRLGAGASSVVYLAERHGTREVLKVARDPDHAQRLHDEDRALTQLRHDTFIASRGIEELAGHTVLRLEPGIVRTKDDAFLVDTLASRLRSDGPPTIDLQHRWGADLLDALVVMERQGVDHRDLKPENLIFVERGKYRETRLAVIDFSLTRASHDDVDAGTIGYLDPFLRDREARRWDLHAERYAAAVVLAELTTGDRPTWGEGVDPRATDRHVPLLRLEGVDAAVSDRLREFFEQALHRDPTQRFDTADDMRRAWERAFAEVDESTGHAAGVSADELDLTTLSSATPVGELGLAPRLVGAIERLGVADVGALARAGGELVRPSGMGAAVRSELRHLIRRLRDAGFADEPEDIAELDPHDLARLSVDRLADRLVPPSGLSEDTRQLLHVLLGLDIGAMHDWPTTTVTASTVGTDASTVTDELDKARKRWAEYRPELVAVRQELVEWLTSREGVATGDEAAELLLTRRGSRHEDPHRSRRSRAVVRACLEAEAFISQPRFRGVRVGDQLLLALDRPTLVEGRGNVAWAADPLVEAAAALGEAAAALVEDHQVVTPTQALTALRGIELPQLPDGVAFDDTRIVRLAAAASGNAAVSSRGELYLRGLPAERAAAAARLTLLDRHGLTPEQVRERVRARFPKATELPARPELDQLLADAEVGLAWDTTVQRYRLPDVVGAPSLTSVSVAGTRYSTMSAADVEVDELDRLLHRLLEEGGFVAATVSPASVDRAARAVADRLDATLLDLDAALIGHMRAVAAEANAIWEVVVAADAAPPTDAKFKALERLVHRALDRLDEQVRGAGERVVATGLGLLARYHATGLLERWREDLTRPDGAVPRGDLRGLVLVIPGTDREQQPMIDGTAIPVVTAAQWARIPTAWLQKAAA
jgi:serine/threonine protein kinase